LSKVNRFPLWLALSNIVWQVIFAANWWTWLRDLATCAWGGLVATLIQGGGTILPTLIVAVIVMRVVKRQGLWP
jgi:hypothetical protein